MVPDFMLSGSVTRFMVEEHVGRPVIICEIGVLGGEGSVFNVWGRKIRDAEERPEARGLDRRTLSCTRGHRLGFISYPSWRTRLWKNENYGPFCIRG